MKKPVDKKQKPMTPLAKQKQKAAIISYYDKKRENKKNSRVKCDSGLHLLYTQRTK